MSPQMPPPPPAKKTPVWVWVLGGIAGLILLLVIAVIGAGLFVVNKVADMAKNPSQLAKIIEKADPNLEVVDVDDNEKTIRVRDKSKNEEFTITLKDLMEGKLKIRKDGKDGVETVELGGRMNLPNWVPKFPGVEPRSLGSAQSDKLGEGGIFTFRTEVSREKIVAFYRDGLEKRGLSVKASDGNDLVMTSEDGELNASIEIDDSGGERRVTVAYGEKKPQSKP